MERIELRYEGGYESANNIERQSIETAICDKDDCGLNVKDVCERFLQFMESVGFSVDTIMDYFK
jgi:hypothetical protein